MLTLLFLIGLVVLVIVATILTEVEHFGLATLALIGTVVGAQLLHVVDVLHYVEHHALLTGLYALGYVLVGVIWSFVKWFSYLMSYRDTFRTHKEAFLKEQNLNPVGQVPDELLKQFKAYLQENVRWGDSHRQVMELERPRASKNKSRIVAWMSLWPCSVVGTVLNDPVRRVFNFLFNWFKSLYQQMADRIFAKDVELK
jgi:hypothetical protein